MPQASIKQAFWDYNFTERDLLQKLAKGTNGEKAWIIGRILENLPYNSIWKYLTLEQVKDFFPQLRLKPKFRQIWSYTLSLWDKHEKDSH